MADITNTVSIAARNYRNNQKKNSDTREIAVITLQFKQGGFTIE